MVRRAQALQDSTEGEYETITVGEALAGELGLSDGDLVQLTVNGNSISGPVRIDELINARQVTVATGSVLASRLGTGYASAELGKK